MSHAMHASLTIEVVPTLFVTAAAVAYGWGWSRIRRRHPFAISARRLGCFMFGLLALWTAVGSPLTAFQHESLTVHMVQHVLLMAVAPPLLLLGAPRLPLLPPVLCWLAPVAALIGWHVPAVFELAMHSRGWHDVQAASFLVTGLLFWTPVIASPSRLPAMQPWQIPVYLFIATFPCDALSAFLVFCDRVVYPSYLSAPRLLGVSALHDQQCAGALMWVSVTLIYLVPAVAITIQLLSPQKTFPSASPVRV